MKRWVVVGLSVALMMAHPVAGQEQPPDAVVQIEKLGGAVHRIAANSDDMEVAFHLSTTEITDEALVSLPAVPNLVWLNLRGTKITDEGLRHLASIKTLTRLHLEKTSIGDAGLVHLKDLDKLEYLNLYGTNVSDEGLQHLTGLKNLKKLFLWQTKVTPEGAARLNEALPDVEINLGIELEKLAADAQKASPSEAPAGEKPPRKELKPPDKPLAEGRFVRVRLTGENRILSLAEVVVVETSSGVLLQSSGTASQSSVDFGGEPQRGSDGNTDQDYNHNSVTHTKAEMDPWWLLDLSDVKSIGRIVVYNRGDCCGDRLKDAQVEVLNAEKNPVWSAAISDVEDGSVHVFPASQ